MWCTWVPALGPHIRRQMLISWVCFLLMGAIFWGLPSIGDALIAIPDDSMHSLFWRYHWLVGFSFVLSAFTFWGQMKFFQKLRAAPSEDPRLERSLAQMARRAGLGRVPQLVLMKGKFNAAASWNPFGADFVISMGEVHKLLHDDEEDVVYAHEISHLKHWDMLARAIILSGSRALAFQMVFLAGVLAFSTAGTLLGKHVQDRHVFKAIVLTMGIKIIYDLLAAAHSRAREYLADAGAIGILGLDYRDRLICGILRIGTSLSGAHPALLMQRTGISLFSSHPEPIDRADALSVIVLPNADGADIIGIDIA